ncbi:Ibr domain protein (macronuclear) [Tetrahymena thermophila SB210]|uniref:RBR-type E3 ubiquitin transferase n=1 Tax=Tetrahymena thermophila (strain SB210) TaxID=312017 RepID=Q23PU7_TETTS|nr:Ibr domain protein [Tetrahymena thermophila SB210]EAR98588.2 Ibr domain protein [Tetrahymena thermophila SB210]|eukprot:XP_001018833.2 Ibr domain protein [Tetrahymena thermophila SB210]
MSYKVNNNNNDGNNNSEIVIDIPDERNALNVKTQATKNSNPKNQFNNFTDLETKMKIFEQQIIAEGIKKQNSQKQDFSANPSPMNKQYTLTRQHSEQYRPSPNNSDYLKDRERQISLQKAAPYMNQFKNRTEKAVQEINVKDQNISYQRFDPSLDNKEKKVLFLKIKILEMQLNLQRAEDYIDKQLPINTSSREQLMENLLDYLLSEDQKEKNMRRSIKSPKKKQTQKPNPLIFQGLANINMAISQELVDCTPKTGLIKQNQIVNCNICCQDKLGTQTIQLSSFCTHSFCISCLEKYISFRIQDGKCTHIYCPQANCKSVLNDKEIQKIISKSSFQQYLKIKKLSLINNDKQIRYCQKGNCDSYVKFSPGTQIEACQYCNSKVCYDCYMPAHKGMTCEQNMEKKLQALIHAIRKGDCPSCKNSIMKIQVENAVRCPTCNFDFCWLCNKKYSKYHYRFWNFCCGCPNMLEAIEQPTFMNKFKYFRKGLFRFFVILLMSLVMLCGYAVSLIILPIFVPGGVFLYYNYKTFEKRSMFEQFLIGVILLAIGIVGYFIWLILCIFPGTLMALRKFYQISEAYLESIGYK